MNAPETLVEMARRHVREGKAHVERQRELVARLREDGHPTEEAETLLAEFEALQQQHEDGLRRLLDEQRLGLRDSGGRRIFPGPR